MVNVQMGVGVGKRKRRKREKFSLHSKLYSHLIRTKILGIVGRIKGKKHRTI